MTAQRLQDLVAVVAFADPAGGKTGAAQLKRTSARMAIGVAGMDAIGRIFMLHLWAKRCATTEFLHELYRTAEVFHPRPFAIEANAMQSLFVDCAEYIAKCFGKRAIAFTPYHQPTNLDKAYRNRMAIQPPLAQGRLFLRDDQQEALAELQVHPRSPVKDLVDVIGTCCSLLPRTRRIYTFQREEAQALAAYLRSIGTPASQIQARLDAVFPQSH